MTVEKLIEILKEVPPSAVVTIACLADGPPIIVATAEQGTLWRINGEFGDPDYFMPSPRGLSAEGTLTNGASIYSKDNQP